MPISQLGAINTTALSDPNVYVQIAPPQPQLNGVPSNILGIVGTASWGPVNSPVIASSPQDASQQFGAQLARKYDLVTAVNVVAQQGANNLRLVRVTDGTDTAATASLTLANAALATALAQAINAGNGALRGASQLVVATATGSVVALTAIYTGTRGNALVATLGAGSAASTSKLSLSLTGQVPETFDNVGATASTAATAGFAGGTDGATTITTATLVGVDGLLRKGMYALRGARVSVICLADADDSTQWTYQAAFALAEGALLYGASPAGDTITNFAATLAGAGIDNYDMAIAFGDWCYIQDQVNQVQRLVSPATFLAGKRAALSPEQSTLNKQLYGILGTQKSNISQQYSGAERTALESARGTLICNPCPGGSYFGDRNGITTSSNAATNGDNYATMTNYIAKTLDAGLGLFVGKLQTPDVQKQAKATIDNFLQNMFQQGQIAAWNVKLDTVNNPQTRVSLGYMQADVMVQYLSIIRYFLVNLLAGQTVTINVTSTPNL